MAGANPLAMSALCGQIPITSTGGLLPTLPQDASQLALVFLICSIANKHCSRWSGMAASEHDGDSGYDGSNTTGFVSPAADALEGPIDLAAMLDLRRPHRYPVRVLGEALVDRGIYPGDVLIADTATAPTHGRVAIVMLHGEVWIAQLALRGGQWWMRPGRADQPLVSLDDDGAEVWAVVAALVRPKV